MKIWTLALVVLLVGCATQKRKEERARNYYIENKEKLAELSATLFPVTDTFIKGQQLNLPPRTEVVPGDTVYMEKDCPDGTKVQFQYIKGDTVKVYLPILQVDTIVRERTDKMDALRQDMKEETERRIKAETELAKEKQENKNKTWWIVGLSVLLGIIVIGGIALRYYTKSASLITKI